MVVSAIASRTDHYPKGRQRPFEVPCDPAFCKHGDPTRPEITKRSAPIFKEHLIACVAASSARPGTGACANQPARGTSGAIRHGCRRGVEVITADKVSANTWRASKLIGVGIYGPDDEKVGDVSEVLVDRKGQMQAIVVGVGGFLGIGEKDVAIPFGEVEMER